MQWARQLLLTGLKTWHHHPANIKNDSGRRLKLPLIPDIAHDVTAGYRRAGLWLMSAGNQVTMVNTAAILMAHAVVEAVTAYAA